jgi:tetratricopeptide (TPR) repeat protein
MRYIVAVNGLAGGLPIEDLRRTLAVELAASQRTANLDVLVPLLEQELPSRAEVETPVQQKHLATIQPDLIGEAAVIEAFTGSSTTEAEAVNAVRRTYTLDSELAAHALVRLVQDFGYAVEDGSATEGEKKTGHQVLAWLITLGRNIKDPLQLIPLVESLPAHTTVLREAAAELTERLATYFGQQASRSNAPAAIANAARWVSDLAVRLSGVGRREEALATAEQAVRLRRALAEARPDAFTPNLALSLNNLTTMLRGLGRREDALAAAEEAVRLCRALAVARPDAFTPNLATSLNNLASMLSDLGRREEALAAAEEAVRLCRALAVARPDAFTPDLAMSLNTLAIRLSALGRREDALAANEEAKKPHK